MRTLSFYQLFLLSFMCATGLAFATILSAWTGPTSSPPNGNVAAPINVSSTDQIKDGGLSLDALTVFGSQYIQDDLGIGRASPVVALDVNGTLRLADGAEVCQAVTEGSQRYNTTSNAMEYCDGVSWMALATTTSASAEATTKICDGTDGSSVGCSPSTSFPILCSYSGGTLPMSTGAVYTGDYMHWNGSNWRFWYHSTGNYYNCTKVLMYTPA